MVDKLISANELARSVRFCKDIQFEHLHTDRTLQPLTSYFHQTSLAISREVTPQLHACLELVCKRIKIPLELVEAFVYPSAELQAHCYSGSRHDFVLSFSSALIEKLNPEEFCFVAGHEIGHFLFGHGLCDNDERLESMEYFVNRRYQEISADRIGLLACDSLDNALKAIMKTASGLSSKYLRFDVSSYVAQIKKAQTQLNYENASHPSMLVRSRALLWFSLNDLDKLREGSADRTTLNKLDAKIIDDFSKYIDGSVNERIQNASNDLRIWLTASQILELNVYSKVHQQRVEEYFGAKTASGLRNFLANEDPARLKTEIEDRIKHAESHLKYIAPYSFEKIKGEAQQWLIQFIKQA